MGIWQMEPDTLHDIYDNCDALVNNQTETYRILDSIDLFEATPNDDLAESLVISPMYACAMARLKYSMDSATLPPYDNIRAVYDYYKRIYNTPLGASTYEKFKQAWLYHKLHEVKL